MGNYLTANFSIRRIVFLLIWLLCLGLCVAVVWGSLNWGIPFTLFVLFIGLLAREYAG